MSDDADPTEDGNRDLNDGTWGPPTMVSGNCPQCGTIANRTVYDIGDGPELCCKTCDWCWGMYGQPLSRIPPISREWLDALGVKLEGDT
jgi:hypothetical protein